MTSASDFDDDFPLPAEFDFGDASPTYAHPVRPERNSFFAWHKPRKQFVRQLQWTHTVGKLMEKRAVEDRLKYVGLPGLDLLDLRQILNSVCEPAGRKLQYIGFDYAANSDADDNSELNISQSELDARDAVYQPSNVRPDDIRHIGRRTTGAWDAVRRLGHIDVVNLDLTTTIFDAPPAESKSYLRTVKEILALQQGNPNPWAMFITTRVDRQDMSLAALRPLVSHLQEAMGDCEELRDALEASVARLGAETSLEDWDADSLRIGSLTSMMLWIRGLLNDGTLATRVELTSCFVYRSFDSGEEIDIASIVIQFNGNPTDLSDPVFDAAGREYGQGPFDDTRCVQVASYARRITKSGNIDEILASDAGLRAEMTEASAALLKQARYSRDAYLEWVD